MCVCIYIGIVVIIVVIVYTRRFVILFGVSEYMEPTNMLTCSDLQ